MKKDVIILKCQKCGEEFLYEYRGSGRKPDYCEDCRKKIKIEQTKLWKEKAKEHQTKTRIDVPSDTEVGYNEFVERISKLLTTLDSTRVELCELAKQMSEYQSGYDKNDQIYLHKLELLDTSNPESTVQFVSKWQNSRNNRRNVKDLIALVGNVIDTIPYKNYTKALPILKGSSYRTR